MADEAVPVLLRLADHLDELGLAHAVGGSLASSFHGEPRSTHDIDLLVALPLPRLEAFATRLRKEFYVPETAAREAIEAQTRFNIIHHETGHKFDVFVAGTSPLDVAQLERCRLAQLIPGQRSVAVTSAAVLVVRKLAWYRSGGEVSERHWRDVVGILRVQGDAFDRHDIADLVQELSLGALLERALAEARGA